MYIRSFHYPEHYSGVKPKELSQFVGPKSKTSEKLDQNWSCLGQKTISISRIQPICQIGGSQAKQGRDLTASILVQFFWNFKFRTHKLWQFFRLHATMIFRLVKWPNIHRIRFLIYGSVWKMKIRKCEIYRAYLCYLCTE